MLPDRMHSSAACVGALLSKSWRPPAVVLRVRHIDHSIGLEEAAHMIAEARAAAAGSSSITGTEAGAGGGGSEGGEPATPRPAAIFDLHPKRPHRRGLKLTDGDIVPFNPVSLCQAA